MLLVGSERPRNQGALRKLSQSSAGAQQRVASACTLGMVHFALRRTGCDVAVSVIGPYSVDELVAGIVPAENGKECGACTSLS